MLHPSTKKLIDRLSEMTAQRKIEWANGEQPNSLVYDTEGYRVLLEDNPANLVLCDALGKELERAGHDLLANAKHADGGTYAEILAEMRGEAERIARGTEDAIASVLEGLQLDDISDEETQLISEDTPIIVDEPFSTPIADAMEDNADELSAGTNDDIIPDITPISPADNPEITYDKAEQEMCSSQDEADPAPETADHSYSQKPGFPSDAPVEFKAEDAFASETQSLDEVIDQNKIEAPSNSSPAFETTRFEDTPDVGKAVADLANQMNDGPPSAPASKPAFQAPPAELDQAAARAATISSFTSSNLGMPSGFTSSPSASLISEDAKSSHEPVEEPNENKPAEAPIYDEPVVSNTTPDAPVDEATYVFKPGQKLSLSGLASSSPPESSRPPAIRPEDQEQTAKQADEAPASDVPEEVSEEETHATEQPTKRFNPWV